MDLLPFDSAVAPIFPHPSANAPLPAAENPFEPKQWHLGRAALHPAFGLRDSLVREMAPAIPMSVLNTLAMAACAAEFVALFPGHVMYAVKCNPDPVFLTSMHAQGVKRFDVASLPEVQLIHGLFPESGIYFMHPVKAPEAIERAYFNHGVRAFVLDTQEELEKILHATAYADDLELFVRIAVPKGDVATDFSSKFGAKPGTVIALLQATAEKAARLGVSFHVGTQCTDPDVYGHAIDYATGIIQAAGVQVETLDIGGGFPTHLDPANPPPALAAYMEVVRTAIHRNGLQRLEILCEAGRGLVADAGSLVVRVEGRKGDLLYINDGTYGGLFEAGGAIGLPYPARLVRRESLRLAGAMQPFRLAGPTCDSVDMMRGSFMLPDDVQAGDWIALDKLGAYGEVSRSNFNGFGAAHKVVVSAIERGMR